MTAKQPKWDELPIRSSLSAIQNAIAANVPVILAAPPGAGKTTAVPLALLGVNIIEGETVMIEPRRMAARSSASRIAFLDSSELGSRVGYQVRFDKRCSAATRLLCATPGILLRRLIDDPALERVSCVLLDEFHERSLEYDLLLGILTRLRQSLRPDLRLIVMSATLDVDELHRFMPEAQVIISEGRRFPVEVRYVGRSQDERLEVQVAGQLESLLAQTEGHILVFLPGRGEITRVHRHLQSRPMLTAIEIMELFGEQSPEAQDQVFRKSSQRRVILSTNVAETSVTIENVTAVIDSGLVRVSQFDPTVGLPRLQLEPISMASADQRAGRAGRTAPGICVRLWPQVMDRQRRSHLPPEILRTDLSDAALLLCGWGERDIQHFPWLTNPREASVDSAVNLLRSLGAIDSQRRVTEMGLRMQRYALHPRLSRLMVAANELECATEAALAASLLSDRSPFTPGSNRFPTFIAKIDFLRESLHRENQASHGHFADEIHPGRLRELLRSARHLLKNSPRFVSSKPSTEPIQDWHSRLIQALLRAFPDRVAKLRSSGASTGVLVGGRGVRFASHVPGNHQWVLCLEVEGSGKEATVREFLPVDLEWLSDQALQITEELEWSDSNQAVVARQRKSYFDLIVSETPKPCITSPQAATVLLRHAQDRRDLWYPSGDHVAAGFIERVRLLSERMPELKIEPVEDEALELLMDELCQSRTSIEQLKRAPWLESLQAMFNYSVLQAIDRHAPTHMTLPSSNRATVHYQTGRKPFLEARIQELFGWQETPRIAGGRLQLQIHLLGPNYRPQQITDDLRNFWNTTYFDVRKELKRRYPKHHWPEDPLTAIATRNGLQPR